MTRRRVPARAHFMVATLLLALTACGGSNEGGGSGGAPTTNTPSSTPSSSPASPGGRIIDDATLTGALLTETDLPSGFNAEPESNDPEDTGSDTTCFPTFSRVVNRDGATHVSRDFTMPGADAGSQLFVSVSLTSYPDAARLQSELDDYVSQLRNCPSAVETVNGKENRMQISESPVEIVGSEQQYSFTISGTSSSITTVMSARIGNNVATVIASYFGGQPNSSLITTALQNDITQAQFDRLVEVSG